MLIPSLLFRPFQISCVIQYNGSASGSCVPRQGSYEIPNRVCGHHYKGNANYSHGKYTFRQTGIMKDLRISRFMRKTYLPI